MAQVRIYTTSWCAFCRAEKHYLKEHNIPFEAVDVEADEAAGREMIKLSGQMGVPFTVITHDGGHTVSILGFNQPKLASELGLA